MKATLKYLKVMPSYSHEKPYELWTSSDEYPTDFEQTNCEFSEHEDIEIEDVRSSTIDCSYETTGFRFLYDPMPEKQVEAFGPQDNHAMVREYLYDMVELVQKEFSASKVLCYDWRYRSSKSSTEDVQHDEDGSIRQRPLEPAYKVHTDESPASGLQRLKRHLTADELMDFDNGLTRIRLVNVWRPTVPVVEDLPLALCDRRTVSADCHVLCDKVHSTFVTEGVYTSYAADHRWYWLSAQTINEPVVFVSWDSMACGAPSGTPHAAFSNPDASVGAQPRGSIEARFIVFTQPVLKQTAVQMV